MKRSSLTRLVCFSLWLACSVNLLNAQTTISPTTTTTQFAGKDPNSTAPSDVTFPNSGLILSGAAINPATGKPFRHLWYGDSANGFCRTDPDVDTAGIHSINLNTCTGFVNSVQFKPGEAAFDPATNNIYAVDIQANSVGVFRLHFLPNGDNGNGSVDLLNMEVLAGSGSNTRVDPGGCPMPGNPTLSGNPQPKVPNSASLGPDNNLWISFKQSGALVRINNPSQSPVPSGTGCQSFIQVVGTTPDNKKNFGLGWIGHDLYGGDGFSPWVMHSADTNCLAPETGNRLCTGSLGPSNILSTQMPSPFATITDQLYPALDGNNLYVGNAAGVTWVGDITDPAADTIATQYGGNFQFINGFTVDATNPAREILYVGDDPSNGLQTGVGRWWTVTQTPLAPAPPGTPTSVTASAGDAQATVSWKQARDGQPVTNYIVHNSFASNGVAVPDVTVNPNPGTTVVPTSITITGLTNGVSYQFQVAAQNAQGSSAFSAASNAVTPQAITVPAAPANVSATGGDAAASVAWTAPANGGSAITGYTVTALAGGAATGITATAPGNATGVNVTGLTNGTTYTFTVHATNAKGNSAESAPSNAVTPSVPSGPPAMTISMSGPASANSGAFVTYAITAANNGPAPAANVIVTDSLPGNATYQSSASSQGICSLSGSTLTCTLGAMNAGGSATMNVTVQIGSTSITNTASLQAMDSTGAVVASAGPASATTTIATPNTTTDVQVTGSAKNGGPAVGSSDTYTWQVKNSGKQAANNLQFTDTLPPSLAFQSASSTVGTCTGPTAGTAGGTITCTAATLNASQTMVVTINVTVLQVGSIATTGGANFSGTDTNQANNSATVTITAR